MDLPAGPHPLTAVAPALEAAIRAGIPDNPVFPAIHHGFVSWLSPQWDQMLRSPDRNLVNYKSHEAIFRAIEERDPDAAEEALINHLKAAWEYVRVTFDLSEL